MASRSIWGRYGYGWLTLGFFIVTITGHWIFGWFAYLDEQSKQGMTPEISEYTVQMLRDTLENWQSEFLQLLWQVGGLAFLLFAGSPQSKEGSDRLEAKVDEIFKRVDPEGAEKIISELDEAYAGRRTETGGGHAERRR